MAAALLRLMLLFHPDWYYGDIEIHLNVTRALKEEGRLHGWMNMYDLQQRFDLGRANVSGSMRPLPYPPFFHTLSSFGPEGMEVEVMKAVGVAAATATILLTLLFASRLFASEAAGLMAGLVLSLLSFDLLEVLRVSFPAILGRSLDLTAMLWLFSPRAFDPEDKRGLLALGGWLSLCCLSYNASPVHFGLFVPLALLCLALPQGRLREARSLLTAALVGALLSLSFYGRYVLDVVLNVMAEDHVAAPSIDWGALASSLARDHGPILVAALAAAPLCLTARWSHRESRLLLAWILWMPAVALVAGLFPGPFGYFRTEFFAYPLLAVLCARWAMGPAPVSRLLIGAVAVWGLAKTWAFLPGLYITHSGRITD